MSSYKMITGVVRSLSEFESFPRYEIDALVHPPFVPGPELATVLNLGGVTINHVASNAEWTHLVVRSPDGTRSSSDKDLILAATDRLFGYLNQLNDDPALISDLTACYRLSRHIEAKKDFRAS